MKTLTRAAFAAVVVFSCLGSAVADFPAFLVLQDGSFFDRANAIEAVGAKIRQRVPPRILIVDLPDGTKTSSLPGIQNAYTSAVPISTLESQGPTAIAAGIQWNRRLLSETRTSGSGMLGSMRQLVADRSLPPPANVRISPLNGHLVCEWDAVDGAIYYEVQASGSRLFEGPTIRTHAVKTRIEIAVPQGATDVSLRIRAIDPGQATPDDDMVGRWSQAALTTPGPLPLASSAGAPTPTSPVNGFQTEGFTLILEWTPGDGPTRVQVAPNDAFTDTVVDEIVTGGEYTCPGPAMRSGDRLYWRTQAWNGALSAWSAARNARIGEPKSSKIDAFVNPEAPQ